MNPKIEKIKEEIKVALEKATKDVSNDYIIQSLAEKIDSLGKIDELYLARLTELIEEQRLNNKLANDIKLTETKIALQTS